MGPKRRVTNRRYKNKKVSSIEVKREIMCELEESVLNSENEITHSTSSNQYINPAFILKQMCTSNEVISSSDIKVILLMWEKISHFILQRHPEKVASARAAAQFDDTCLTYFRNILNKRNIQNSVDRDQLENYVGGKVSRVAKKRKLGEEKFETHRLKLNGRAREPYVRLERLDDRITPVVLPVMEPYVRLERLPCTLTENSIVQSATPKVETCLKITQHSEMSDAMDETTVEVDIQQDTNLQGNCTPSSEVIASPLSSPGEPIVVIPEARKIRESVIRLSPSKNHVTENERVMTSISVKNQLTVRADSLESESVSRNSTCSPEVIDVTSEKKRGRRKRLTNDTNDLSSTSLLRRSGRCMRNVITVKDEPIVVLDIQRDTSVEGNSTPSSEVITSPLPLRSDPIVVIPEPRETQESLVTESPSVDHVKENERLKSDIYVKNRPTVRADSLESESVSRNSTCSPEVIDITSGKKRGRKKRLTNGTNDLSFTSLLRRSGRCMRNVITVKDEPVVEVDIQQDTNKKGNCTPSEVIASPLPLRSDPFVVIPDQGKTQEGMVIQSPSVDLVKENEIVKTNISVKNQLTVRAESLESESVSRNSTCSPEVIDITSGRKRGRRKRLTNGTNDLSFTSMLRRSGRCMRNVITVKDEPIVVLDIQQDTSVEGNSTPSSEVIASPLSQRSDPIVVIPEPRETQESVVIESPSVDHMKENEGVRTNISVKEEPIVDVDIQLDTNVEVPSTPSSEVIASPLPLRNDPIVVIPEPRETPESVVIESPSVDHVKESEGVRTNISVKTPWKTLLSGKEPYVRLERLDERYIQSFAARSVTPKRKGAIRLKKLEDILAMEKNDEPLVVFEQHTNGDGNNVPSPEFNGGPTPLVGDQMVAIPGQGKTQEIQTIESSPNGREFPHQLEEINLSPTAFWADHVLPLETILTEEGDNPSSFESGEPFNLQHSPVEDDILLPFHTVFVEEVTEENEKEKREETFQQSPAAHNLKMSGDNQHNVRPYQCSVQDYFNAHMTSQTLFTCDMCSYRTDTLFDLNGHMTVHKNLEPLVCPICHYRYINKCALEMHMSTH